MPRTNLGRNIANEKIVALIWGTAAAAGLTTEELGAKAKISRSRIYARKTSRRISLCASCAASAAR